MLTRIKSLFVNFTKKGLLYIAYWVLTYVVPLILVNEKYVFTKHYSDTIRLTISGYILVFILYLMLRKWLYGRVLILKPGLGKWVCCTFYRGVPIALLFVLLEFVVRQSETVHVLLLNCTISLIIGALFQLLYFINKRISEVGDTDG